MKSPAVKPTITQAGFKISKTVIANARKCVFVFHYKLADLGAGYVGFAKENLTAVGGDYYTFAFYLNSGKTQYLFYYGTSSTAVMNTLALVDDSYYKVTAIWNGTNHSFKMEKLTRVNNVVTLGNAINSTVATSGANIADIDLGILAANYSNGSLANGSKAKICCMQFFDENDNCLAHVPFSEGTGNIATDVCNGTVYTIANETDFATFRNYTQDFSFYNFRYGFTLYQKSGSPDLRIPNKEDGTEIVPSAVPSGYSRIANYKECKLTFNQCENLFKLDDTSMIETLTITKAPRSDLVDTVMPYKGEYTGKSWYEKSGVLGCYYYGDRHYIRENYSNPLYISASTVGDVENPALIWYDELTGEIISIELQKAGGVGDLYSADPDHYLFTESTGVAREIDVQDIYSDVVENTLDRGHLYINEDSNKNMMLYKTDKGDGTPEDLKVWKYVNK